MGGLNDASIVLATVAMVVAVLYVGWLGWAVASRNTLLGQWSAWSSHKRTTAAQIRDEADQLVMGVKRVLSSGVPGAHVVTLKGSVLTGAVKPDSDVDVFVWTKTCGGHDAAAARLLKMGVNGIPVSHIHSGGKFTLLTTHTHTGRPADISIAMDPTDTVIPSLDHLNTRGFFEFIARRNHPSATIRTSHI